MKAKISQREIWCLNWNVHFFGLYFAIFNTKQVKTTILHVCAFPNAPSNLGQKCKITFFAFVKIFPTLCIQMYTWMLCMQDCILTLFAFFYFSSLCIFGDPNNIRILSFLVKPNNIRIRIRSFLGSRIIFVFVFGHFRETK